MKIRTITTGFNLKNPFDENDFKKVAEISNKIKKEYQNNGFIIQTNRVTTQPWEDYFDTKKQIIDIIGKFKRYTKKYNIDYFNIGTTYKQENIPLLYDFLKCSDNGFCSVFLSDYNKINYEALKNYRK